MKSYVDENSVVHVTRKNDKAYVKQGYGYYNVGENACVLKNTGNGYIAKFPSNSCVDQDYYVCLSYSQAYDLILALAEFKKDLGFK